jgi:ankyrin repeat protein
LIVAGATGRARIVALLLHAGADVNATDARGTTALMLAAENVDTAATVDALLEAGSDPNLKDKEGRTALQIAERSQRLNRSGAEEVINLLKPVTKSGR